MKLYTGRGDKGQTDLHGGQAIDKDAPRVAAYGTVDELNSAIGLAIACGGPEQVLAPLWALQSKLFDLGAELATPPPTQNASGGGGPSAGRIGQADVERVEGWIDTASDKLAPMRHFILPGGTELAARLHLARTVCRRAERLVISLQRQEPVAGELVVYLNRMNDLFFALARLANHLAEVEDVPWIADAQA